MLALAKRASPALYLLACLLAGVAGWSLRHYLADPSSIAAARHTAPSQVVAVSLEQPGVSIQEFDALKALAVKSFIAHGEAISMLLAVQAGLQIEVEALKGRIAALEAARAAAPPKRAKPKPAAVPPPQQAPPAPQPEPIPEPPPQPAQQEASNWFLDLFKPR
jgi:outer membrane biosynthesis protein TonB